MEIIVYFSLDCKRHEKRAFCQRVKNFDPDSFDFTSAIRFLKSVFGTDVIIEFCCV